MEEKCVYTDQIMEVIKDKGSRWSRGSKNFKDKVEYISHNTMPRRFAAKIDTGSAVHKAPLNTDKTCLKNLLGEWYVYKRIFKNFSKWGRPPTAMLNEGSEPDSEHRVQRP